MMTRVDEWIYDVLFALVGGTTADVKFGYCVADRYYEFIYKRRIRKLLKKLGVGE